MKNWPALDVPIAANSDRILFAVDDFSPTAIEERERSLRVFFSSQETRAAAQAALASSGLAAVPVDVSDEDWARRSQEALDPVAVGRITVFPNPESRIPNPDGISIVIQPSMGFGTGHHATTRLCLAALQAIDMSGRFVLDVGTGSGVLAIAAARLGASRVLGIDCDADAIASAAGNLALNPQVERVEFRVVDFTSSRSLATFDVVTANLTGALLVRVADRLVAAAIRPGGTLIVSGLLAEEEAPVRKAFSSDAVWRRQEDEWVALAFQIPPQSADPSRLSPRTTAASE